MEDLRYTEDAEINAAEVEFCEDISAAMAKRAARVAKARDARQAEEARRMAVFRGDMVSPMPQADAILADIESRINENVVELRAAAE